MVTDVRVRPCVPGDEDSLALVGQATFLETFAGILDGNDIVTHCAKAHSAGTYRSWLADSGYALWLAECSPGNAPVGFMVVAPPDLPLPDTSEDLELKRIYLLSRFQGGGVGKYLVRTAVSHATAFGAKRLLLGVYAHNHRAIAFYERVGFRKAGTRRFNVGGQDYDDHIMALPLDA